MEMKESDVLDRWTILLQKARFNETAKEELEKVFDLEVHNIVIQIFRDSLLDFLKSVTKLQEANAKIWILESAIRKEFSNDPSAARDLTKEEIADRALLIRDYNKLRLEAKKEIDVFFHQLPDVKVDHSSQET